jgi:hypothetical protein
MKLLAASLLVGQFLGLTPRGVCQEASAGTARLHFSFPFPENFKGRYELTAANAQRMRPDGATELILELRGDVEVRTIVCRPTGNICDKSPIVLRADAIDYNEATGEIRAQGTVNTILVKPSHDSKFSAAH